MWTFVFSLLSAAVLMAESSYNIYEDYYEGAQVLRVVPDTKSKVDDVRELTKVPGLEMLDAWMPTFRPNRPADFYANKIELPIIKEYLQNKSISYFVLVKNVTKAILAQRARKTSRAFDYKHFHNLEEIYKELDRLGKKYSNISKVFSLGPSYEKREMKAIQIKSIIKPGKKIFFIECGTHAREWLSPATCMWLIRSILRERHAQETRKGGKDSMCNRIDWVIVPVLNVDGYAFSWTKTGRFWRKNRRPNVNKTSDCYGTDLNRNWGYEWGGNGSKRNPCKSYYGGNESFSEVETRNVAKYLYRKRCHLLGYIGLHSYSQFWMTPWGYKKELPEHYDEMKRVADIAVNAIKNSGDAGQGTVYEEPGPSSEVIYHNTGSAKDWTYAVLNVQYSYGVELRPHYNYSDPLARHGGFLIPPDQIKHTGREIVAAIKAISNAVHLHQGSRIIRKTQPAGKTHYH